jgi:cobalt-zinc-cadmium efflux system membrane fusion protein
MMKSSYLFISAKSICSCLSNLFISSLFVVALMSCSGGKSGEASTSTDSAASEKAVDTTAVDTTAVASPTEGEQVDATTSATAKANEIIWHGVMEALPQHHASVSVLSGGVIKRLYSEPGQYVRRGQSLAVIANQEFVSLQQEFLDCKAQAEYLKTEYQRQKALATEQASSQKKMQQSRADYLSMTSRMHAAAVRLGMLGLPVGRLIAHGIQPYITVTAPISGYVSSVGANMGKYLQPGDAICEIINKDAMVLKLTVYEKDADMLKTGAVLSFRTGSTGDRNYSAVVTYVGQHVESSSRALDVYARIMSYSPLFRPGMYISAMLRK